MAHPSALAGQVAQPHGMQVPHHHLGTKLAMCFLPLFDSSAKVERSSFICCGLDLPEGGGKVKTLIIIVEPWDCYL